MKKIEIDLCYNTGKSIITIGANCSVDFTRPHTFRKQLGFESLKLETGKHYSTEIVNVQLSQKIYIECNLYKGSYMNNSPSQIIYSFPNELKFGSFLNERPKFPRRKELLLKNFHEIRLYFYDENKLPIDFMKELVTVELFIEQA